MSSRVLGGLFYALVFTAAMTAGPVFIAASRLAGKPEWVFRAIPPYFRFLFRLFGVRVEMEGREKMQPRRIYLVLANHQSFLDIPILLGLRLFSFVAKVEIKSWPLFGNSMVKMNCIFVNRKDPRSRSQVGPQMLENMSRNVSYCLFPEGTRSPDGRLLPFKIGIFRIAKTANLPILPIAIAGSGRVLPKKPLGLFPGRIRVRIGDPINPSSHSNAEGLRDAVRAAIAAGLESPPGAAA